MVTPPQIQFSMHQTQKLAAVEVLEGMSPYRTTCKTREESSRPLTSSMGIAKFQRLASKYLTQVIRWSLTRPRSLLPLPLQPSIMELARGCWVKILNLLGPLDQLVAHTRNSWSCLSISILIRASIMFQSSQQTSIIVLWELLPAFYQERIN